MKRTISLLLTLALLFSGAVVSAAAANASAPALILNAPADVTLTFYTGFKDGEKLTPASTEKKGDTVDYVFPALKTGKYRYVAKGKGYYTVHKQIYYVAGESRTVNADPGKHSGSLRFDPRGKIIEYTDEVLNGPLASSKTMFGEYNEIFTTPAFTDTENKARHQMTTQKEMEDFIASLDGADDHMYVYTLGVSPKYHYKMPLVVFTKRDLSGAATFAQAAELLKADADKPIIQYTAQIHSNEPAAGEGALAMIQSLDGKYGDSVLDSVNVYVIPRVNPDGAYLFRRANAEQNIDMNRDGMYQQALESQLVHSVYNAFLPHVAIDGHEFSQNVSETGHLNDVLIGFHENPNLSYEHNRLMLNMNVAVTDRLSAAGLRPYYYSSNTANVSGRNYYQNYGSLSFLIETRGINFGKLFYERRVVGQYASVKGYIDYTAQHVKDVLDTVNATRTRFKESGKTYSRENTIVLKRERSKAISLKLLERTKYDFATGSLFSLSKPAFKNAYRIAETRQIATAYVIPAGEDYSEEALAVIRRNGLEYYELERGSAADLAQYVGSKKDVVVSAEKRVVFANGAYVIPANQIGSRILALLMEPYVADSAKYNCSLVMAGVIPSEDGKYPIYRYEHDLEPDGRIRTVPAP